MCYHKQDRALKSELEDRYRATLHEIYYQPTFYENAFDFKASPVVTTQRPHEFTMMHWGLIPAWTKSRQDAEQIKTRTLNCVQEEMYTKPSFKDVIREGKRCLIPCTGFYEWRWFNSGKTKYPYFIHLSDEFIFSIAGIYSSWVDRSTGEEMMTYSVLTTRANPLMEKIHNSKKRMPVIITKENEKDWLNPELTPKDVHALCEPIAPHTLQAYTVSKLITDRRIDNKDVPDVYKPFEYPELALFDS